VAAQIFDVNRWSHNLSLFIAKIKVLNIINALLQKQNFSFYLTRIQFLNRLTK
jgi:hypothetical protein